MRIKNPLFYTILSLLGYVSLLTQLTLFQHVTCTKTNGVTDIELASLNYKCQCIDKIGHDRHHSSGTNKQKQLSANEICCLDIPLGWSWGTFTNNFTKKIKPSINRINAYDLLLISSPPLISWWFLDHQYLKFPSQTKAIFRSTILRC